MHERILLRPDPYLDVPASQGQELPAAGRSCLQLRDDSDHQAHGSRATMQLELPCYPALLTGCRPLGSLFYRLLYYSCIFTGCEEVFRWLSETGIATAAPISGYS